MPCWKKPLGLDPCGPSGRVAEAVPRVDRFFKNPPGKSQEDLLLPAIAYGKDRQAIGWVRVHIAYSFFDTTTAPKVPGPPCVAIAIPVSTIGVSFTENPVCRVKVVANS